MCIAPHLTQIIVNPQAGAGHGRQLWPQILQWLVEQGAEARLAMPDSVATAVQLLKQLPPRSRVVVVGGDGTLNGLLPQLLAGQHSLGLVACGSGNDSARAWGLHRLPWRQALSLALHGTVGPIDVGCLQRGDQLDYFLSSLTVGFDSAVCARTLQGSTRLRGLPRYLWATLGELAALRRWEMTVELDGQRLHQGACLLASVLNTPTYASGMAAVPHALVDDGQLNLLLAGDFNRWRTAQMLPLLLAGRHLGHAGVLSQAFVRASYRTEPACPLAVDGEFLGASARFDVLVLKAALNVVRAPSRHGL